jgi:Tetrapyrrole (Corrin/Porphyrin) Methylases
VQVMPFDADIYLAGLGMFELRHLTIETLEVLKRARVVYHLSDKHAELCAINPNTQDLDKLYSKPGQRVNIYEELASFVVNSALETRPIVLAIDGNPMFFSDVSWKVAAAASKKDLRVEALPAVSCIDVLPTQLGFEPGDLGMQIFEATQLVLYSLAINPYLSTLVLQIGYFLKTFTLPLPKRNPGEFLPLVSHLSKFFPEDHPAIFIQSACSHQLRTTLFSTTVAKLDEHRNEIQGGMTLYLPRVEVPPIDAKFRALLELP